MILEQLPSVLRLRRAERDAADLHAALFQAIQRLMARDGTTANVRDLLEVLDRTSRGAT